MMEHNEIYRQSHFKYLLQSLSSHYLQNFGIIISDLQWPQIMCLEPLHQSIGIELMSYRFSSDVARNRVQKHVASLQ